MDGWRRHFFYRKEVWKTTWTFRLSALLLLVVIVLLSRRVLADLIANRLVCAELAEPSDAILVENFNSEYLVYERAAALKNAGVASRVFVTVWASGESDNPEASSNAVVDGYAQIAHLSDPIRIPVIEKEPITLNVAKGVRDFLLKEKIRSMTFVTSGFRSQRSVLVYNKLLTPAGIRFGCVPVFGKTAPENWDRNWHGIQDVIMESGKLLYYQFYVLRH